MVSDSNENGKPRDTVGRPSLELEVDSLSDRHRVLALSVTEAGSDFKLGSCRVFDIESSHHSLVLTSTLLMASDYGFRVFKFLYLEESPRSFLLVGTSWVFDHHTLAFFTKDFVHELEKVFS